jgi:hypothetical protein
MSTTTITFNTAIQTPTVLLQHNLQPGAFKQITNTLPGGTT